MIIDPKEPRKLDAVLALRPNGGFTVSEGVVEYLHEGDPEPTEDQIQAKLKELKADYDAKKYQRDRELVYPSIQDVVVALAEKEEGDDTMWKEITAKRQKVKADNPKPE